MGTKNNLTKYNNDDGLTELESKDDVATQLLGSKYKTPTQNDFKELIFNTLQVWTKNYNNSGNTGLIIFKIKNQNDGGKFYDKPIDKYNESVDEHIFIPASEVFSDRIYGLNDYFHLWSSTIGDPDYIFNSSVCSSSDRSFIYNYHLNRSYGCCIRPIKIK